MGVALGFLFEYLKLKNNEHRIIPTKLISLFFISMTLFSFLGAKIFFIITSKDSSLIELKSFWLGGGYVFYGGLVGGLVFLIFFSYILKIKFSRFEAFTPGFVVAHGVGRLGCVMAGCCFGKICPLDIFERWPVQFIESVFLITLGIFLSHKGKEGRINTFKMYLLFYSCFRFMIEFLRGDELRGIWVYNLSTSQLISFAIVFFLLCNYLYESFSTKSSDT